MLMGSTDILNTVKEHLGGIQVGETTKDGKFTLVEAECLGACSNAPMFAMNDDFYVSYLFLYRVRHVSYLRSCRRISRLKQPGKYWMRLPKARSPHLDRKADDRPVRIQRD